MLLLSQPNFDSESKTFVETAKILLGEQQTFVGCIATILLSYNQTVFSMNLL